MDSEGGRPYPGWVFGAVRRTAGGALAALLMAGCVHPGQGSRSHADDGTCYGACDHYLGCKGDERPESRDTCLAECREIFVQDGKPDRKSLRMFEDLECEAAVAFVDGEPSGRRSASTTSADDR